MKYIKLFELFDYSPMVDYELKKINNNFYCYYFTLNGINFGVYFDLDHHGNWERNYFRIKKKDNDSAENYAFNIKEPYGIANKIISSVTYITNEFIKMIKPTILIIKHIPMTKDYSSNRLNKRASINYQYLKNLPIIKKGQYELKYYNKREGLGGITICLIVEKGFNGYIEYDHSDIFQRFYPQ